MDLLAKVVTVLLLTAVSGEYTKYYRLDAQILRNFSDVGERTCCKECASYTNCLSVNYNMNNHSCELNVKHVPGLPGKNGHHEYVYMDRSHCNSLLTSCPNVCNLTCGANQKCFITSTNQQTCIITECDPSDVIPNITPRNVRREVGRSRWFRCTIPPTTSYQYYTCDTDGQWVKHYPECQCWYGTYLNDDVCSKCPAGKHLPHIGHVGSGSCIDCPAGHYTANPGSGWCSICHVGSYQSSSGQTNCNPCPVGKYINVEGATSCKKCKAGSYQDMTGETKCKSCPEGKYSDSDGASVCKDCSPGSYSNVKGSTSCMLCPAYSYQSSSGATSCEHCIWAYRQGSTSCSMY